MVINWTVYNSANSGLAENNIYSIAVDTHGNKWIGIYGGGVSVFNENGVSLDVNDEIYCRANDFIIYPNPAKDKIFN